MYGYLWLTVPLIVGILARTIWLHRRRMRVYRRREKLLNLAMKARLEEESQRNRPSPSR